ncbi:MAG: DNA-processing protein DprA [Thermoplasmata archaeon]
MSGRRRAEEAGGNARSSHQRTLEAKPSRPHVTVGLGSQEPERSDASAWRSISAEDLLGALSEIERKFAPKRLNIAGRLELPLAHPRVAIIGTRTASPQGVKTASHLAERLARNGVTIVSGLARGIDTAAHEAAIGAGGATVAVLGTPLSETYPKENASLQRLIMAQHLAISQFAEGRPVQRQNFILRNRTMALIADASIIVESGEGGGSLHQGWEALRLGRPLFIHASEFSKKGLGWPRAMVRYGAVEFNDPEEVLSAVPSASVGLAVASLDTA